MRDTYRVLQNFAKGSGLVGSIVVMTNDLLHETTSFPKQSQISCWAGKKPNHFSWDFHLQGALARELANGGRLVGLATELKAAGSYWWLTFMMPERNDIKNDTNEVQFTMETENVLLAMPYVNWAEVSCSRWP